LTAAIFLYTLPLQGQLTLHIVSCFSFFLVQANIFQGWLFKGIGS
jgi:hypothetical protein